ncbi:hypothetical protein DAI22_01g122450 [Oryza sativa Japonica Group]|nr:hypothetical protein DAI22_01g122450 [Oryza sativa Japonica Group]
MDMESFLPNATSQVAMLQCSPPRGLCHRLLPKLCYHSEPAPSFAMTLLSNIRRCRSPHQARGGQLSLVSSINGEL